MHIAYLEAKMSIYTAQKALKSLMLAKKVNLFKKYAYFLNVFFKKSVVVLYKR